jgi:hypothetical protein
VDQIIGRDIAESHLPALALQDRREQTKILERHVT